MFLSQPRSSSLSRQDPGFSSFVIEDDMKKEKECERGAISFQYFSGARVRGFVCFDTAKETFDGIKG